MRELDGLTEAELEMIGESGVSEVDPAHIIPEIVLSVVDWMRTASDPLASLVLARVSALIGPDGVWTGDNAFSAEWTNDGTARICRMTRVADGSAWLVSRYDDRGDPTRPEISLSKIDDAGHAVLVASGKVATAAEGDRRFGTGWKMAAGMIDGRLVRGAFPDLRAFCEAIAPSLPAPDGDRPYRGVYTEHMATLKFMIEPVLAADGGLPGRLCEARHAMTASAVTAGLHGWMRPQIDGLLDGLRDMGAVWGSAYASWNDGDHQSTLVEFSDGSRGLFGNDASGSETPAYVARFAVDGGDVVSVSVYALRSEDDKQERIAGIDVGEVTPDFVFDFATGEPSFPGGRAGWTAAALFLLDFPEANEYALGGELVDGDAFWEAKADAVAAAPLR